MKKAKIMLMAIAVFGIIGGALAFKANKSFGDPFYALTNNGVSTYWIQDYTTQPSGSRTTGFTSITTVPVLGNPTGYFGATLYYGSGVVTNVYFAAGE